MFQSINTEQYKYYPPDQQGSVFQSGINACDKAVEISKALEDLPCEAKFISTAAYSYQSIGNPFSSPASIINNVKGALGAFSGYSVQYKTLIIPK